MRVWGRFWPASGRQREKNWQRRLRELGPSFVSPTGSDAPIEDSVSTHPVSGDGFADSCFLAGEKEAAQVTQSLPPALL